MESSEATIITTTHSDQSPPPPGSPPPCTAAAVYPTVVVSPCAACKILRRRCADKCELAPYFPPSEPLKFTTAHRVFGASNIIKFLQKLPESQRADAVSSMVYEANVRIRDPVYGCAGVICQLQKQVSDLQAQLAKAQAEVINMQCQHANLLSYICLEMVHKSPIQSNNSSQSQSPSPSRCEYVGDVSPTNHCFIDDDNYLASPWEALWT